MDVPGQPTGHTFAPHPPRPISALLLSCLKHHPCSPVDRASPSHREQSAESGDARPCPCLDAWPRKPPGYPIATPAVPSQRRRPRLSTRSPRMGRPKTKTTLANARKPHARDMPSPHPRYDVGTLTPCEAPARNICADLFRYTILLTTPDTPDRLNGAPPKKISNEAPQCR